MIVTFTGHRPDKLGGYGNGSYVYIVERVIREALVERCPDSVISGMALGTDQAAARAAIQCGIPVCAALPFAGQDARWPAQSQAEYAALLAQCAEVRVVCPGTYQPWKFIQRDAWMVSRCDEVWAVWDGSRGGTGSTVEIARRSRKPITNFWERIQALR